jgi:hypothetical protein
MSDFRYKTIITKDICIINFNALFVILIFNYLQNPEGNEI